MKVKRLKVPNFYKVTFLGNQSSIPIEPSGEDFDCYNAFVRASDPNWPQGWLQQTLKYSL